MADALDLDALEATAKAATPGPWRVTPSRTIGSDAGYRHSVVNGQDIYTPRTKQRVPAFVWRSKGNPLTLASEPYEREGQAEAWDSDAAFIAAANPATVLALIARCRAAEERADNAEGQVAAARALPEKWRRDGMFRGSDSMRVAQADLAALAPRAEATPEREVES